MPYRLLGTGPKLEQSPGNRTAGRWGRNEWFKVTGSKWEPVAPYSTGRGGVVVRTQTARRGGFSVARSAPPAALH